MSIDDILKRLCEAEVHPALATLDGGVLADIARARADNLHRPVALASAIALLVGIAGAGLPTRPAVAETTLAPFGASALLMPSTLLGGAR